MSNSNSNQMAATISAITASIDWEKLDGTLGKDILQDIQRGCQKEGLGEFLTRMLVDKEWLKEAEELKKFGYPNWAKRRLTPGIDDNFPFYDGSLISIEPVVQAGGSVPYAVIYDKIKPGFGLWSCIGLQTLVYYSQNPTPDLLGKRIFAWKSVFQSSQGQRFVPCCNFASESTINIEYIDLRLAVEPKDHTMRIHA